MNVGSLELALLPEYVLPVLELFKGHQDRPGAGHVRPCKHNNYLSVFGDQDPNPDPYIFGPAGSGSISTRYRCLRIRLRIKQK